MYECYHIDDTLNVDAIQAHIIRFDSTGCIRGTKIEQKQFLLYYTKRKYTQFRIVPSDVSGPG